MCVTATFFLGLHSELGMSESSQSAKLKKEGLFRLVGENLRFAGEPLQILSHCSSSKSLPPSLISSFGVKPVLGLSSSPSGLAHQSDKELRRVWRGIVALHVLISTKSKPIRAQIAIQVWTDEV
jgi:hypothetical protein